MSDGSDGVGAGTDESGGESGGRRGERDDREGTSAEPSLRERLGGLFKGQENLDLTEGGIGWPLFYLSLPIVVTNLFQTAYNLADTFWLGQYSTVALAAISFGFPLVFLLIALGMGLSTAGSVLVAQNTGAGDVRQATFAASQTVTFSFVGASLIGAGGYFLVDDLLSVFGAEPAVLRAATEYMQIIALGLPLMFGFFVFVSLMRGAGDTVTPMVVMFGTVVLNIVLDPIAIFGLTTPALAVGTTTLVPSVTVPELGVAGAAYATILSRGLAMVVGVVIMLRGDHGVSINPRDMVPDPGYLRKILRIGVPASIEGTGRAVSINLLLLIVGGFPTTVVAAFGIGIRVFSLIFMPAIAIARGVETMAGQNIGAGKPDRAEATADFAAKAGFVLLAGLGAVIFLFPAPIVAAFTDDPAVVDAGATFLRFVAPTFGFTGIMRAYSGGLRGAGKTLTSAGIAITMNGVIRLPIAATLAALIGATGIWSSFVVANIAGGVLAFAWYKRGTWRGADVTDTRGRGPGPGAVDGDDAAAPAGPNDD